MKKLEKTGGQKMYMVVLFLIAMAAAMFAHADSWHGKHGKHSPLERMLKHLDEVDLSDEQAQQIDEIVTPYRDRWRNGNKEQDIFPMMKSMIELDPNAPEYDDELVTRADTTAELMRTRLLELGRLRKEIYSVLTTEQEKAIEASVRAKMAHHHRERD